MSCEFCAKIILFYSLARWVTMKGCSGDLALLTKFLNFPNFMKFYSRFTVLNIEEESDVPTKKNTHGRWQEVTSHCNCLLQGTKEAMCQLDLSVREVCCLPELWIQDVLVVLVKAIQHPDC